MDAVKRVLQIAVTLSCLFTAPHPIRAQAFGDLFGQYLTALDGVGQTLAQIKNVDEAKATLPKLQAAVNQVVAAKTQLAQLKPDPNNPQTAAVMKEKGPQAQQVTARVSQEVNRVRTSPQLAQVLHETLAKLP